MSQPTEEQIITALENSGYLFEQDVASILGNLDFHVETNFAYNDIDSGKSREVDVRGVKEVYRDEDRKVQVIVEFLIECKDFGSPLVFLERAKNNLEQENPTPNAYLFPKEKYREKINDKSYREIHPFQYFNLKDNHYYFKELNKATQFSKIYKKSSKWFANHEGIYDSLILPQAKLLESRKENVTKFVRGSGGEWKGIWLFFPMVVIRDNLFSYDLSGPERNLQKRDRVSFVRHLDSSNLKGSYLTDFTTFEYLTNFVCLDVCQFYNSVLDIVKNNPNKILG